MKNIIENEKYLEDLNYISSLELPWEKLRNRSILISGTTGMIGSCFTDAIMLKNNVGLNCRIYAMGRNKDKILQRFSCYIGNEMFVPIEYNINSRLDLNIKADYVLHLASNTHPVAYSTDPIGTISANIIGLQNMLEYACDNLSTRTVFASSNEIYGENRGDIDLFDEAYCGYIDCNTLRAGYPESKRCSEALCQAYIKQKQLDIVIARFTRTYVATMLPNDTKAISQFIKNGVNKENIVLKSKGTQLYSYTYVVDAVSGLLTILLKGENGEAYNISDNKSNITLKDLAQTIANISGTNVIFEIPDDVESAGYSKATKALLSGAKLCSLGWNAKYDIASGVERTLNILCDLKSTQREE